MQIGDLATWFTGAMTAAVFAWTLHAWRVERRRVKVLESRQAEAALREQAGLIAAWLQRSTDDLRQKSGLSAELCPNGTWSFCISNEARFALYEWTLAARLGPPPIDVDASSRQYGPIGPRAGIVVIPLTKL